MGAAAEAVVMSGCSISIHSEVNSNPLSSITKGVPPVRACWPTNSGLVTTKNTAAQMSARLLESVKGCVGVFSDLTVSPWLGYVLKT